MRAFVLSLAVLLAAPLLATAHEAASETVIKITEQGFDPSTVTIPVGTTVRFENAGTRPHWPASNIHPTHTLYPGSSVAKCGTADEPSIFDACRGIAPGASYSFTFDYVGSWKMHDHLAANHTGAIVVTGSSTAPLPSVTAPSWWSRLSFWAKTTMAKAYYKIFPAKLNTLVESTDLFALTADESAAHEARLRYLLMVAGADRVMKGLVAKASDPGNPLDCHQQAHRIGRVAFGVLGGGAFADSSAASCHSGFYHGAMEAFLTKNGIGNLATDVEAICKKFSTRFGEFECLHGVGHGVLAYEDYDLPEALKVCDTLSDSWKASSCYGGVFMENIVTAQGLGAEDAHTTTWANQTDPLYPCDAISQSASVQTECYKMQTSWMLTISGYDFKKVAGECAGAGAGAGMRPSCYLSLGRDGAGNSLRDPGKMRQYCSYAPEAYYDACISGAVNVVVDYWGPDLKSQASDFCNTLAGGHKDACLAVLAVRQADFTKTTGTN